MHSIVLVKTAQQPLKRPAAGTADIKKRHTRWRFLVLRERYPNQANG
jgi:hypothetical protein